MKKSMDQVQAIAMAKRHLNPSMVRYIYDVKGTYYVATWHIDQPADTIPVLQVYTTRRSALDCSNDPADF